ncbi:TetR/AcrR family transcriptional regulator [Rhodococcus gannanensis]|uniref:Helix-turn-helix domain-containing protein n=1 Tax=Rhodococcus gannanensis TaxID=1960308 RepID=A0ABW4P972_9NOCA
MDEGATGRRERGKAAKHARIAQAARELFAERGYEAVTTQQVADRADIAAGTLFRYASTKAELLLMVRNEEFAAAVTQGASDSESIGDPVQRVLALIAPVIRSGRGDDENLVAYQRELLFGPPDAPFRVAGLAIVARLEELIAGVLVGDRPVDDDATAAARAVFAVLHMEIAAPVVRPRTPGVASDALRRQIELIVAGHHARRGSH